MSIIKLSVLLVLILGVQLGPLIAQVRPDLQQVQEEILLKLVEGTKRAKTVAEIPAKFREVVKQQYDGSKDLGEEVKFERFLANRYLWAFAVIDNRNWLHSTPTELSQMCDDGIIRNQNRLNPAVWSAAWTGGDTSVISDANLPIASWSNGIVGGNNIDMDLSANCIDHPVQPHHSIVTTGADPTVSTLSTTAPGETHSIRLGNRCMRNGAEKIKKTFKVTANTFSFWYATVMTDRHGTSFSTQPGFGVYVYDSVGTPISTSFTGLDLDASQPGLNEFLPANATNSFQLPVAPAASNNNNPILYKKWTPVTIDLSAYMGQTVTVVFANRDCLGVMDWAYTYLSSFCASTLGSPTGAAEFNKDKSECEKGELCFDYTIPKDAKGNQGTTNLTLELYQNGSLVTTLTSGALSSNGTYCFHNVTSGLNAALGGYDWRLIANFNISGATISPKEIGKKGSGFVEGKNNDCSIKPDVPPVAVDPCCPPINPDLIKENLVYKGSGSFNAPYTLKFQQPPLTPQMAAFNNSMQAYINYVHTANSSVNKMVVEWKLHDQGSGGTAATTPGPLLETNFTTWTAGGSGNPVITGVTNFFGTPTGSVTSQFPMKVNNWYLIRTRTITQKGTFYSEKCIENDVLVRIQILAFARGGSPVLEISNRGGKIIGRVELQQSKK